MKTVYVGNLPPDIRIKDIDDFFSPFGKLVYIDINHRSNPVYACVQFSNARNAYNAVKYRHGHNYEGYTLQMKLTENEVRNRRDGSPPPPPPPIFSGQNNSGGFNNLSNRISGNFPTSLSSSSFQSVSQWSDNNNSRSIMPPQQNMLNYSANNRSNMQQQNMMNYSSNNRSNMPQQNMLNYSGNSRSYMQQQNMNSYPSSGRSNMSQQYSSTNGPQQNITDYPNTNRSIMPMQNMMNNNPNTISSSWRGNNNISGGGNDYYNERPDYVYNSNNDSYAEAGFVNTRGLSGSGRKWFQRFIKKGFSPDVAYRKALEHKTVPYDRDEPKIKPLANVSTNAALTTIGNKIMSLLSSNPNANFNSNNQMMPALSNWGGDNFQAGFSGNGGDIFDMPGPSNRSIYSNINNDGEVMSRRGRARMNQEFRANVEPREIIRNTVSKAQYLRSLDIIKKIDKKRARDKDIKDRFTKKMNLQIVRDYERYQKQMGVGRKRGDKKTVTTSSPEQSYTKLLVAFKKKKQQLLVVARSMPNDPKKRSSAAYKKNLRLLTIKGSFPEIEAKTLALHPIEKLNLLMSMKSDYETALKKKQELFAAKPITSKGSTTTASYRNDLTYLKMHEKQKIETLSKRVKAALRNCLERIHKHEEEKKLPLTKSKFSSLLLNKPKATKSTNKNQVENKKSTDSKKNVANKGEVKEANKTKDNKEAIKKTATKEKSETTKDEDANQNKDKTTEENQEDNENIEEDEVMEDNNGDEIDTIDITEEEQDNEGNEEGENEEEEEEEENQCDQDDQNDQNEQNEEEDYEEQQNEEQ